MMTPAERYTAFDAAAAEAGHGLARLEPVGEAVDGGESRIAIAYCACGTYESAPCARWLALKSWRDHVRPRFTADQRRRLTDAMAAHAAEAARVAMQALERGREGES